MKVMIELNQKFGHGYQIHFMCGPVDDVYDEEPLALAEAGGNASYLIDQMNAVMGTSYEPHEVVSISQDALEANQNDFTTRRFLKDIESGTHELSRPTEQADYKYNENGEVMLSARGVLLYAYTSWFKEGKQEDKGKAFLRGYCRLLAGKGYGGGARAIFEKMAEMEIDTGVGWCKATYARHMDSAEIMGLLNEL